MFASRSGLAAGLKGASSMDAEQENEQSQAPEDATTGERERSTIQFPYMDLSDALQLVEKLHQNVGQGEASEDQLAAWMNLSPKSSGFRLRIGTARMFGLIESQGVGLRLTALGRAVMDPAQARK